MMRQSFFVSFLIALLQTRIGTVTGILNRQLDYCRADDDCSPGTTLLFCISGQCQCLSGGSTNVYGLRLDFNMEWSPVHSKCVSREGSPCTFKGRWYPPNASKLDCNQDSVCIPHSGPTGSNNRHYQNEYPYQNSRYQGGYEQGQGGSGGGGGGGAVTADDFGVCWHNKEIASGATSGGGSQSHFYPILNPNPPEQHPSRHEFVSHGGNPYPVSPSKDNGYKNSATSFSISDMWGFILLLLINFL